VLVAHACSLLLKVICAAGRYMIPGGSAPEMEVSFQLMEYAKTLSGAESFCVRAFAEALEIIPATLAENAGLNPISIVTELRLKHAKGEKYAGVNVRKVWPALNLLPRRIWCISVFYFALV
jgi:chaperonin GroEL (HSP60 family)